MVERLYKVVSKDDQDKILFNGLYNQCKSFMESSRNSPELTESLIILPLEDCPEWAKYPIYHIVYRYYDNNLKQYSLGSFKVLEEHEFTEEKLNQRFELYAQDLLKRKNFTLKMICFEVKEYEEWLLKHFSHVTIDVGQSDEEAYKSFSEFIERYRDENEEFESGFIEHCDHYLMGALDYWRVGHRVKDENCKFTDEFVKNAPCRCKGCKENKVLIFEH